MRVPPQCDRPADIEWLAEDMLQAAAPGRHLTDRARAALVWATTERGRGLVELMTALGLYPSDLGDREQLRALLEKAGVPGGDA